VGILQNLDRLAFTFRIPFADFYIGRQSIAWGSARVINPTDVIAPFTFDELDKEERIGVDAVRLRVPLGMMGEFDTGYVLGKDAKFENSAFFTRLKLYQYRNDISLLLLGFRENFLAGFDLARSIGGAGSWLEMAYVWTDLLKNSGDKISQNYFRASLGMDYSLTSQSYAFIEYHYNGAGESKAENYLKNYTKIAYQEGSVYLLSKHYLTPGMSYQITPLVTGTAQILANLTDPSVYLALDCEYNIAQNIYLSAGAFVGIGSDAESLQYTSEFGGYPQTYYLSFRIYY
jgi:hypothetical protein